MTTKFTKMWYERSGGSFRIESFNRHIAIVNKAYEYNKSLGFLLRNSRNLSIGTTIILYNTLVRIYLLAYHPVYFQTIAECSLNGLQWVCGEIKFKIIINQA